MQVFIMPLSEFLRMASRKSGSGQHELLPTDLASQSNKDIVELLWENGRITTQGQSSLAARTSPLNNLPSNTNKARTRKLSRVNSVSHNMSHVIDNNMAPWFDSLTQDCNSSVFLPEMSGVASNNNGILTQNGFSSVDKRGSYGQVVSNLQQSGLGSSKDSYSKARQLSSWPPPPPKHRQTSDALGSGVSGNHSRPDVLFGNQALSRDIGSPTNNSSSYLNFSRFARPANLLKADLSSPVKEKSSAGSGTNPKVIKPTLVEGYNSVLSGHPIVAEASKDSCPSEILCQETPVMNDEPLTQNNATESAKEVPCRERIVEPVVASSSVGSGNSADRVSFEQTHDSKRKYRDIEDSEGRSEDVGTESVGVEKTTLAGGSGGSKRGRAAEVHNLSERRRRDRINEKMRALQELIPNSNKSDKASMLEEAIEYLKTLQAQVQILSMGAGLCMPQMMSPPGMQHIHPAAAHIPHFSPMGMLDFNSGCPVFPLRFSASLPSNIQGMPSPNLPVYGHPVQGLPLIGQPSHMNSTSVLSGLRTGSHITVPSGNTTNTNSQSLNCFTEANQLHAADEVLKQCATVQKNKQTTNVSSLSTMTSIETNISKEPCEQ